MINLALKQTRFLNVRKEYKEQNRLRINFEKSLNRQLIIMFNKIGSGASEQYINAGQQGIDIYLAQTRPMVEATLEPFYFSVIKEFAERFENTYIKKLEDARVQELLNQFILGQGSQKITAIDETTRKGIQKIIQQGASEGLGVPQIAKNIDDRYKPQFSRYRASVIARTEVHSASTFANHEMAKDLRNTGVELMKQWVANTDDRVRDIHLQANGQKVSMEEDFMVGGMPMQYTGDPRGGAKNVINCRCVTIYIEQDTTTYESPTSTATTKLPPTDKRFVGFGDTNPDELEWHNNSFANAPISIKNTISLFPALERVSRGGGDFDAYANQVMSKDKLIGGARVHMGGKKGDINITRKSQQTTWRHEYGHTMDYQMDKIIPKDKLPKQSLYNTARMETHVLGRTYYSANFADEIIEDRKALAKKYKNVNWKVKQERDYDIADTLKKEGFISELLEGYSGRQSYHYYKFTDKKIDKKFLDKYLTDGKIFTGKELKDILFQEDGLKRMLDYKSRDGVTLTQAHLAAKIIKINKMNKMGDFRGSDGFMRVMYDTAKMTNNEATADYILTLADYLGAVTNNAIGFGHTASYYSKRIKVGTGVSTGHGTEAFANYMAFVGDTEVSKIYKPIMKKFAPNITKRFDEGIEKLEEMVE